MSSTLRFFRGDLDWVHAREDYRGALSAYWPGGSSGLTLRPGLDVGHAEPALVERAYRNLLTEREWREVSAMIGRRGESVKQRLRVSSVLRGIRISWEDGQRLFALAAEPYWQQVADRYPDVRKAPGCIHTAMLSLAFNRGPANRELRTLGRSLRVGDWLEFSDIVGAMQQDHRVAGVRRRRKLEAQMIRECLRQRNGS